MFSLSRAYLVTEDYISGGLEQTMIYEHSIPTYPTVQRFGSTRELSGMLSVLARAKYARTFWYLRYEDTGWFLPNE